jgi:8-oxo-dGTP diphosphatase
MGVDPPAPKKGTIRPRVRVGVGVLLKYIDDGRFGSSFIGSSNTTTDQQQQQQQQRHTSTTDTTATAATATAVVRIFAGRRGPNVSHGHDMIALPGGHLDMYENWIDCTIREVQEEMDIVLDATSNDIHFLHVTNDPMPNEHCHYVTIVMGATLHHHPSSSSSSSSRAPMTTTDTDTKEILATNSFIFPTNAEPDKCWGWNAYTWEEIQQLYQQQQLFGPLAQLVQENPLVLQSFLSLSSSSSLS